MKICLSCEGVAVTDRDRCAHCDVPLVPTTAAHFPHRRGETDSTNPLLGRVIEGKYLIQGVLGRGGMGTVFRACHQASLVPLALKLLHPRLSARAEFRRALLAEAQKAGRVVHDRCARVLDVGETEEGTVYLAMELVEGESIDTWVREGGLSPAVAVDVLEQVCSALVAIHRAGLVHRDLSSRNVMVAVRDGRPLVKVLDFGIAQSLHMSSLVLPPSVDDGDDGGGETAFANPVFSAPEHLSGRDVDPRADLYSFGVLAYVLLCGRLPVESQDARAAVRATLAGRLLPLQPTAAVPRRLLRLVQRCLSLERDGRPPSAEAVLQELHTLQSGRLRWLPSASVAALALSTVVAIGTFAQSPAPFLQVVGGGLPLQDGPLLPEAPVHYLAKAQLRQVEAHFGGFRTDRLEVEVRRGSTLQWRRAQDPVVASPGELVLSELQAPWRETLDGIARASANGPVDVAFVVPGVAVLGSARLCIDDEPPTASMQLLGDRGAGPLRLDAGSVVRVEGQDRNGVADLRLRLVLQSGATHEFPLPAGTTDFELGAAMARQRSATAPLGPGRLELLAVDRAQNRAAPEPLAFVDCDFGAPTVVEATGPAGETAIPYLDDRARLRVRLGAVEPELRITVRDADGQVRARAAALPSTGGWCELELAATAAGFATGFYTFEVEDPAGNRGTSTLPLAFRSRRLDAVFGPSGDAPVAVLAGELVVGPAGGEFGFWCGPAFAPQGVALGGADGAPMATPAVAALAKLDDHWLLTVPPLPPGTYRLRLDIDEPGDHRAVAAGVQQRLTVLPESLTLRLPEARQSFLPPLLRANLFERSGDQLLQGGAVRIDAEQRPYLRGYLWIGGSPDGLVAEPLVEGRAGEPLLPPTRLLRGRNLMALDLRDVLGRPAAVLVGDEPAPRLSTRGGDLACVADFHDDPTPPQPAAAELRVEFEQPVWLVLRTRLPFAAADLPRLHLVAGASRLQAASVQAGDAGAEIAYELPVAVWSAVPELAELPRERYALGVRARLAARLETPAGDYALQIALRTARTTLRAVGLDIAARSGALDPRLAAVQMVPVLAPDGGTYTDPVPAAAPGRGLFRQQPVEQVRGFDDYFVQDREFTLGQYAALLRSLAALRDRDGLAAAVVHADDPLGPQRLQDGGLLPAGFDGNGAAFAAAAVAQPDAAIVGVDFFQAYAAVRGLGLVVGGDAGLFRLPLGCELELAAFGPQPPGACRNGAGCHGPGVQADSFARWQGRSTAVAGPGGDDEAAMGDLVPSPFGRSIHGLDFGVREWVLDLPQGGDTDGEPLLREWAEDRAQHVQRALELAGGRPAPPDLRLRLPPDLQARLRGFAVVRGLGAGEAFGVLDVDGRELPLTGLERLPPSVPGVVRTEQLRRDGRDLMPGQFDPRFLRTGFRIVGDRAFVQAVRGR